MRVRNIWAVYFSATGTTEKTVRTVAAAAAEVLDAPWQAVSFTLPQERQEKLQFCTGDLVFVATPVYAGRVPNVLLPFLTENVIGNGALAVPVVLYGNRNYDDALMELRNILQANHFACVAGAAFVGEHAFSRVLAAGRPDAEDCALIEGFGEAVGRKVRRLEHTPETAVAVGGCDPIRPYYKPRDRQGNFINILKVKPVTDMDKCSGCGLCAEKCPMGSISAHNVAEVAGICIKCCACVKGCPTGAKYFTDEGYLYHQHELEEMYARRGEVEMFL
ncbi:MAG: ferredoxin [Ruminococcaceae bacterium]|nr:ferredoxin [Oscillospiraceae bacterium]